jgi:hypothetical protein
MSFFNEEYNNQLPLFLQNNELFSYILNKDDYNIDPIYSTNENTEMFDNNILQNKFEELDEKSVFPSNINIVINVKDENSCNKNVTIQNLKNEEQIEENKEILKKKRGRKKLGEKRDDIIHSNYDNDNIIYKIKVQSMKCIYELIINISKKNNIKIKLNKIEGNILKDGKKSSNLNLFQKSIKDILLMNKSTRYIKNPENIEIIEKIKHITIIQDILKMKFIDFVEKVFMDCNLSDFIDFYGVKSSYLFNEIELSENQRKTMKNLREIGILKYFHNIKERKRKSKKIPNI